MAENYFLLPADSYTRDVNPVGDWINQTALYASKMTGKPYDSCVEHLRCKLRNKVIEFKNPKVIYFERGENGDRFQKETSLTSYLRAIQQNNEVMAPTLTSYLHPTVKESKIAMFLDDGVSGRKKLKKLSQKYESAGEVMLYKYYNNAQDAKKRRNNSVSGGMVADGSVIQNKSGHSTLTSVTRSISSLSNASNERLIEGTRHYFTMQIALNNLISITSASNIGHIDRAIAQFQLRYPTVDDTMACLKHSTELYWRDRKATAVLKAFVEKLTQAERAAIVYTGDLYHLRLLNEDVIRTLITDLSLRGDASPVENPTKVIWTIDEQIVNYAHQICISIMAGIGKDYDKLTYENMCILVNTCRNIEHWLEKYSLLIKAFFLTKNCPATIATIPDMIRRTVVLSDTDSTMFSVDSWVEWYFGKVTFDDPCYAVGGAIMFIATQAIAHIMAVFSANMNVDKKRLHTLAMKPEFVFPVFAQTAVAKHYYTATKVKEGNVWKDIKMEIKGVHLKDSSVPSNIIAGAAKLMEFNIRAIMKGETLSLVDTLKISADVERDILASIYKGETRYLKRVKIKEETAYALDGKHSPYQYYTVWEECFAPTYAPSAPPPYQAVRLPLDLPNKTAVLNWLGNNPNQEFAKRMLGWMTENKKVTIGSLPIPMEHCTSHGVPAELVSILDTRKIVLALTKSYRNILGSMGYFSKRDLLISEQGY